MKPYLAILIDSFWEAVANRVLWVLLIGWAFILAGLAPFGYVTERSFKLVSSDIDSLDKIKEKLVDASKGKGTDAVKAVVAKLNPEFVEQLKPDDKENEQQRGKRRVRETDLARELNAAIDAKDLYSAEAFPTADKRERLKPLIEQGVDKLSDFEREELNRELLSLAFPLELTRPRSERLWIGYAGFKLGEPLNISRRQIKQFVEPLLLGILIKLGLGVVAVFVAIIVTSPIVPDTFRSGSLHLLLSKPISRIWLYIFKLLGGCVFVFFNITFVLIGLYLIAGIRFDIWNEGLLYCIPLLLFVFIIFYSVSALVGLIWGNTIVCVVSCIIFWLFCFAVGAVHDGMQQHVELLPQISRLDKIDGKIVAVNQRGDFSLWNDKFSVWQPCLENEFGGEALTFGPLYDPKRKLIAIKTFFRFGPFGNLGARSRKLSVIRLGDESPNATSKAENDKLPPEKTESISAAGDLTIASTAKTDKSEDDGKPDSEEVSRDPKSMSDARSTPFWMGETGPEIPAQLVEMTKVGEDVIAICRGGIFRLNWDKDFSDGDKNVLMGVLKNLIPATNAFENVSPKDFVVSDNSAASATADGNGLAVYSSGNVHLLKYEKNKFTIAANCRIGEEGTEAALIIANDKYCVVARDSLPLTVFDSQLKPVYAEILLPAKNNVRQLSWIPGTNEAAMISHTGNWLKLNCETGTVSTIPSPFAGQLTTMTWESSTKVLLGLKPNRAAEFDLTNNVIVKKLSPQMSTLEMVYNWGVNPIYQVNPKPAALDDAMGYLLSGNTTKNPTNLNPLASDLEQAQAQVEVWRPLLTNLAFVAVMLTIGCIYVARKEF